MLKTCASRRQRPRPIKSSMSPLSKAAEVADKAVGDVGEADKVEPMAQGELYPKKKLTR